MSPLIDPVAPWVGLVFFVLMSNIEWTTVTLNVTTGCTRVSAGCDNCYAVAQSARFAPVHEKYEGVVADGDWTGTILLHPEELDKLAEWKKPRRIFVNSMSDLGHEEVPDAFRDRVFDAFRRQDHHVYQVLSKRPGRIRRYLEGYTADRLAGQPIPNVWVGTSVENQRWAEIRTPKLQGTPAEVRFLSCEPLLGPIDLTRFLEADDGRPGVDWVIAGGESGPKARPLHPDWVRDLRDQCHAAGVPFFFKQWGAWAPTDSVAAGGAEPDGKRQVRIDCRGMLPPSDGFDVDTAVRMVKRSKKANGRKLDGRTWDEFPKEVPT